MSGQNSSRRVYLSVVEDVISNVREAFLDEGIDEQVLQELKQLWENKLTVSRALDPVEPEPIVTGNLPYQLMQAQPSQAGVQQTSTVQHQIPVPVQINSDGQISNAASMAFNAQGGMFSQQVQALVNVSPGAPITLHQTANGQYILQALPQGVSQAQMVQLPQAIIQNQHGQIQQIQTHSLPQLDGTHDEEESAGPSSDAHDICLTSSQDPLPGLCSGDVEVEVPKKLSHRLKRDLRRAKKSRTSVPQLDGNHDTSSSEDDNFDDDDDDNNDDDDKEDGEDAEGEEEEPLNSGDDVSEEDPEELFDTENVVVCQFEKINRNKNKWKFILKDGIMNLDGKDHVFQRGTGEADW